jgi:hypothetical protein
VINIVAHYVSTLRSFHNTWRKMGVSNSHLNSNCFGLRCKWRSISIKHCLSIVQGYTTVVEDSASRTAASEGKEYEYERNENHDGGIQSLDPSCTTDANATSSAWNIEAPILGLLAVELRTDVSELPYKIYSRI